jgi:hypothetical protein
MSAVRLRKEGEPMKRANKSKHNSTGKLLNISRYTGGGLTPLVTADNRMIRRMRGERGKK